MQSIVIDPLGRDVTSKLMPPDLFENNVEMELQFVSIFRYKEHSSTGDCFVVQQLLEDSAFRNMLERLPIGLVLRTHFRMRCFHMLKQWKYIGDDDGEGLYKKVLIEALWQYYATATKHQANVVKDTCCTDDITDDEFIRDFYFRARLALQQLSTQVTHAKNCSVADASTQCDGENMGDPAVLQMFSRRLHDKQEQLRLKAAAFDDLGTSSESTIKDLKEKLRCAEDGLLSLKGILCEEDRKKRTEKAGNAKADSAEVKHFKNMLHACKGAMLQKEKQHALQMGEHTQHCDDVVRKLKVTLSRQETCVDLKAALDMLQSDLQQAEQRIAVLQTEKLTITHDLQSTEARVARMSVEKKQHIAIVDELERHQQKQYIEMKDNMDNANAYILHLHQESHNLRVTNQRLKATHAKEWLLHNQKINTLESENGALLKKLDAI